METILPVWFDSPMNNVDFSHGAAGTGLKEMPSNASIHDFRQPSRRRNIIDHTFLHHGPLWVIDFKKDT
jgi:hypothetical protein